MGQEIVNGVPLVIVVMGLVEFCKQLGATGRVLTVVSMLIGLALGMLYQCSLAVPVTFAGWFAAAVYGLALGLTASGISDFAKQFKAK
jgi:hypothetical protein